MSLSNMNQLITTKFVSTEPSVICIVKWQNSPELGRQIVLKTCWRIVANVQTVFFQSSSSCEKRVHLGWEIRCWAALRALRFSFGGDADQMKATTNPNFFSLGTLAKQGWTTNFQKPKDCANSVSPIIVPKSLIWLQLMHLILKKTNCVKCFWWKKRFSSTVLLKHCTFYRVCQGVWP